MEYTGKLYGEGGIPLMLTASDVDALGPGMTLADDICRCLDASCRLRETCARWVERDTGRVRQATFRRGLLPCCSFETIRVAVDPAQGDMFGGQP